MSQQEFACRLARGRLHQRLDGPLEARERDELDAHLVGCAECRAVAEGLSRLTTALGQLPELELAEVDLEVVWARTVEASPRPRPRRWLVATAAATAAAAALLVVLWGAGRGDGDEAPTAAELVQAKAELRLVTQLTERALRASQRGAVETTLGRVVNPALQRVPVVRRN